MSTEAKFKEKYRVLLERGYKFLTAQRRSWTRIRLARLGEREFQIVGENDDDEKTLTVR